VTAAVAAVDRMALPCLHRTLLPLRHHRLLRLRRKILRVTSGAGNRLARIGETPAAVAEVAGTAVADIAVAGRILAGVAAGWPGERDPRRCRGTSAPFAAAGSWETAQKGYSGGSSYGSEALIKKEMEKRRRAEDRGAGLSY
jgi:CelD/BcsL family acetyltransferase involved in cellulose biosynthesis